MLSAADNFSGRSLWLFWLLVLSVSLTYSWAEIVKGSALESNLMSWIPLSEQTKSGGKAWDELRTASERSFTLLLAAQSPERGLQIAKQLRAKLAAEHMLAAKGAESLLNEVKDFYFPYRAQLLTQSNRQWLIETDQQAIADSLVQQLYSPIRRYRPYSFSSDPFNLAADWQLSLLAGQMKVRPGDVASVQSDEATWYVINGELIGSPFDTSSQHRLQLVLESVLPADAQLLRSGLVFHAIAGASIAKSEISSVGLGSLLGILLLVVLVFRSSLAFVAIALVLLASTIFAVAATLLVFGKLHLITLAFGATLLGLAADYCFHFLTKWRAKNDARSAASLIAKGVFLSLLSSSMAYLLQFYTPFPGLHQFAVFIVSGLAMACFTVVFVLPLLFSYPVFQDCWAEKPSNASFFNTRVEPFYRSVANYRLLVIGVLLCLVMGSLYWLQHQGASDDVRLLNTSGEHLLADERRVSELTSRLGAQKFFLVNETDPQRQLAQLERLVSAVTSINGSLPAATVSLLSIAKFEPSQVQQQKDFELVQEKLYGPNGALKIACKTLANLCDTGAGATGIYLPGLTPASIPPKMKKTLKLEALVKDDYALALPIGEWPQSELAENRASEINGIEFVDNVASLTTVLAGLRQQISLILIFFVIVLSVLSVVLFGQKSWALIFSLLLSVLFSLAASIQSGITLFHVLALLLVMGLTVDTSIFYIKLGLDSDTWLASSLSCGTSLLAFGLLSLSDVAVLAQFGAVVFFGLLCAWLLTPLIFYLFFEKNSWRSQHAN